MQGDGQRYQYVFTVFTPTYNREHTLHRVYDSLCNQTFRDFEWLIVDDGSTDNTRDLVQRWQQEANFPIRYIVQENQGKHAASNRAVQEARGELFLTLDSDDACVPDALARFKYHWDLIPDHQRERFSAVTALCVDQDGRLAGTRFPYDPTDSDSLEIRYKYKVKGEKWGFQRTDIMREFPFPTIEGYQEWIPESSVWNAIAREYKTRYVNEPLRIYWQHRGPSLAQAGSHARHAPGRLLVCESMLNRDIGWFRYAPKAFFREAVQHARFSFHVGRGIRMQAGALDNNLARALWAVALPLGYFAYLADKGGLMPYLRRRRHRQPSPRVT